MKSLQTSRNPYPIERLLSAATYLTAGGVGFVWLILAAIFRKTVTNFLMYHILQSIFISLLCGVLLIFFDFIDIIIKKIPIICNIPYLLNMPLSFVFNLSILQVFSTTIILYLAITSFLGLYSYLPYISDIVKGNTKS